MMMKAIGIVALLSSVIIILWYILIGPIPDTKESSIKAANDFVEKNGGYIEYLYPKLMAYRTNYDFPIGISVRPKQENVSTFLIKDGSHEYIDESSLGINMQLYRHEIRYLELHNNFIIIKPADLMSTKYQINLIYYPFLEIDEKEKIQKHTTAWFFEVSNKWIIIAYE